MQITYKDHVIQFKKGTRDSELIKNEITKYRDSVIACKFNHEIKSLDDKLEKDGTLELIPLTNKDGMRIYMRGIIYIISKAFKELFPEVKITVNYQLNNSMFCNIYYSEITDEIIKKVYKRAR